MNYTIPPALLRGPVDVFVIGAGGTGSHVINGLVQLHTALVSLGHPGGLRVNVVDDDTVSESNVGRQAFVWSDIGQPKATVLVNRLNQSFGLNWNAIVARLNDDHRLSNADLVIGCVDNRAARRTIHRVTERALWLDIGNRKNDGQILLGENGSGATANVYARKERWRLPTVADLFPELIDPEQDDKDDTPSCSLAEALEEQGLFINRAMALHALNLLWMLFRHASIDHHGLFVNMQNGRTAPLPVDPAAWKRFGYDVEAQYKVAA